MPLGREAVHKRSTTAIAPMQFGIVQKEFHCPLPQGSEVVSCTISTVPLPATQHSVALNGRI